MPLRVRLLVLIGLVLLASLACGSLLVGLHAVSSVRTEMHAALDVGVKAIRNGIDELQRSDESDSQLRYLINTFNGNRHVRATLLNADNQPVTASELFIPTQPVPKWFRRLIGGELPAVRLSVPDAGTVVLQANPINEVGEVWSESRDAVLVLAGFAAISAVMICIVVGRSLRPIENLSTAFTQVGTGQYHGKVPELGPPELASLARGFNLMTQRLAVAAAQNRRLNERLLTLQAEERADLARDLHDEIGPLLFAVDMTAATIERLAIDDRAHDIPAHIQSIHDAVSRAQRHVRVILERLRPIHANGLEVAISQLTAFWQSRRPNIALSLAISVDEDRIDDELNETIYRIVQEGISNAIKHGDPTRVEIAIAHDDDNAIRVQVADDGTGMAADGITVRGAAQLGLVGMRERVTAMAGSLTIQHGHAGKGVTLVAVLPHVGSLQYQDLGMTA